MCQVFKGKEKGILWARIQLSAFLSPLPLSYQAFPRLDTHTKICYTSICSRLTRKDKIKKGAKTMTSTITILGKRRKLTGSFGNYFLAEAKDMLAVGIYHGLPLHLWRDDNYLNKIRARKEQGICQRP